MTTIVALFGIFIIGMCVWGIAMPKVMIKWVLRVWNKPWGIYMAIAVRIGLGVVFILVAGETRFPTAFIVLGYLMIIAAVMIAIIGRERLDRFIQWWVNSSMVMARAWLVLGVLFGVFLLHAVYWQI